MNFFKKLSALRAVVDAAERQVVEPRKLSGLLSCCRHAKRGLSGTPPKPLNSKPLNDSTDKQLSALWAVVDAARRHVVTLSGCLPCGRCWDLCYFLCHCYKESNQRKI
jgi:hypothetical protein